MPRPQFSLKSLLWLMAVVGVSLSVGARFGDDIAAQGRRQVSQTEWQERLEAIRHWNALNEPLICGNCSPPSSEEYKEFLAERRRQRVQWAKNAKPDF
jgi:hypothetical protein